MSRPVAGLACRVRVPVRQYQAVAVVIGDEHHVIRLLHRDAGLSIDVEQFKTLETAEEYRDRLAGFLNLPPIVMSGAPAPRDASEETAPQPRRRAAVRRRPRFLMRRRSGAASPLGKIAGREIIARN